MVSVDCRYRHSTTFKDVVEVAVRVQEMSALKIVFGYTMESAGHVVCTATSTHCFLENGRPVSLEKRFPELYAKIQILMGTSADA